MATPAPSASAATVAAAPGACPAAVTNRRSAADLLSSYEFGHSETLAIVDVVRPVAQWVAADGTMTTLESAARERRAHQEPPPGVGTDLAVSAELASQLGHTGDGTADIGGARFRGSAAAPRAVFEELRRATAGGAADFAGVTWERVDAVKGESMSCPPADRAGAPRLLVEPVPAPAGRARLVAVEHRPTASRPATGRQSR
ncbi:hypothetical protein Cs7R123_34600 [Catellatospora sp. TT07R-123]|uniref:hypothetical protein n=1 Tax=Catellatospora sp. TT07R-123 TaxID=2733863 RepID=UPI001B2AE014|nr:hypothetical protein [Catellatospora sp. TT07R-123]GHJ46118.1 hypothetical protein Cs7R123_34600 [Catellatospora sp. TT07R-123]